MAQVNITLEMEVLKGLFTSDGKDKAFARLLETILNQVLEAQVTERIGAAPYERSNTREAYRNGSRSRGFTTRVGSLRLNVPRLRNGEFTTELFTRYQRSEQALVLAMMEMVINGVSTRKVQAVTKELCGESFSKSTVSNLCKALDPVVEAFRNRPLEKHYPFVIVDAFYTKVRENKRVSSKGILVAMAVNEEGYREVIGFEAARTETEVSWSEFFSSLQSRGLKDVDTVISDDHKGLVLAIRKHFQRASWQRCQTHFSRNILDKTPKSLQKEVLEHLHSLYEARDMKSARACLQEIIERYEKTLPEAVLLIEEAFDDITAIIALPKKYRKRLRTTNSIERLNEEIRRRERVIRIFPNKESLIRLMGALLMEQDERWSCGRKYLDMAEYYEFKKNGSEIKKEKVA